MSQQVNKESDTLTVSDSDLLMTDVTQRRRQFPSWEGQGVGGVLCGVFVSTTHPQPLPGGEFAAICIEPAA
ncbi:hypothetical protein U14_04275 [Candidatus Moduliflexus flocculans]|uniref:Uncharacterized protein n=1 Tax=Candidatus Moduliflexus flocculans TaxID=1499966 RepID=A0A0S6W078_9BACT|nr:hypothetical protein U14_04275 [Candidatus Moduliflexus flocculans]